MTTEPGLCWKRYSHTKVIRACVIIVAFGVRFATGGIDGIVMTHPLNARIDGAPETIIAVERRV